MTDEDPAASIEASPPANATRRPPLFSPPAAGAPVYAVLTENHGVLRSGQVVFGCAAAVSALGGAARLATPAEISVSAPAHFPLEA